MEQTRDHRVLLFGKWPDKVTLGAFCAKANLVDTARKCSVKLRGDYNEKKLFNMGIETQDEYSFDDLAFEMKQLRENCKHGPEVFDNFILNQAGIDVLDEILHAIEKAHDWETPEMKAAAHDIMETIWNTGNNRKLQRTRIPVFGEDYAICEMGARA